MHKRNPTRSKLAEVQCALGVAEVRKITANLSQTCGFAVAKHLLQFFGNCGCGIEFKFAVPSTVNGTLTRSENLQIDGRKS